MSISCSKATMVQLCSGSRIHGKTLAYATTTLGATMMHSVFMFYYVKIYLHRFHITEYWFHISQVTFMIWNAINDPLFGYFQDNFLFVRCLRSRRESILYGAPLFALSFILTWFPWGDYDDGGKSPPWLGGLQLMFVLCFYDTLFTFVLLAQCALFAELSSDQEDRVNFVRFSQVASLIGSSSVLFCESITGGPSSNFGSFQMCCIVIGLISCSLFVYTGLNAQTPFDVQQSADNIPEESTSKEGNVSVSRLLRQTCQIFSQRSFVSFVLTNLCQIFHTTFLANFAGIICDRLIPDTAISRSTRSTFYGVIFIVPQVDYGSFDCSQKCLSP